MGRRWASVPVLAGMLSLVVGSLFIVIPNWARAQAEFRTGMELYVWAGGSEVGPIEAGLGTIAALARTVGLTFVAGVVHHPILTVLFGVGFLLAGIWLIVEYGILASDAEPWRGEFEM